MGPNIAHWSACFASWAIRRWPGFGLDVTKSDPYVVPPFLLNLDLLAPLQTTMISPQLIPQSDPRVVALVTISPKVVAGAFTTKRAD
jgi:hypothetical protein